MPLPPVLFNTAIFSALLGVCGDEGAQQLIRRNHSWNGTLLSSCDSDLFFDIDTNEDYEQTIKHWKQGGR